MLIKDMFTDMIFAHVGFASDGHNYFVVDYSRTLEQVYTDFALLFVRRGGWGAWLDKVGDPNSRLCRDLPSWLPDWSSSSPSRRQPRSHARWLTVDSGTPPILTDTRVQRYPMLKTTMLSISSGQKYKWTKFQMPLAKISRQHFQVQAIRSRTSGTRAISSISKEKSRHT